MQSDAALAAPGPNAAKPWWETRLFVLAVCLSTMVPLLYPTVPPLVDLFGHMGRYRVQLDLAQSPALQQFYTFDWSPIGNLGVDLLIVPVSKIFGLELGVKLIVLAIPPATAGAFMWCARQVHHRLPPTVVFAVPFVFSYPFMFGFVNYTFSIMLAFLAFGLWLRMARLGQLKLRALLFVPISFIVFFAHTFGWGMLGLLAFSAEAVRQHDRGTSWWKAALWAALHAIVMALPALVILIWRSNVSGSPAYDWFNWDSKWTSFISVLRDRWQWFDWGALIVVGLVLLFAIVHRKLTFSRNLAFSALVLLAVFLCLPRMIFASAYADMRLVPYVIAVAVLAIRFKAETDLRLARYLAIAGVAFLLVRMAGTTASFAIAATDQNAKLAALDHIPVGARAISISEFCPTHWAMPRNSHLGAMVIVRRQGFSNDQWITAGVNLLGLANRDAGIFSADPSQVVRPKGCPVRGWKANDALSLIPRDDIEYLWLIDVQDYDRKLVAGMRPVWRNGNSILYQVRP